MSTAGNCPECHALAEPGEVCCPRCGRQRTADDLDSWRNLVARACQPAADRSFLGKELALAVLGTTLLAGGLALALGLGWPGDGPGREEPVAVPAGRQEADRLPEEGLFEQWLIRGNRALAQGQLDTAEEASAEALKLRPQSAEAARALAAVSAERQSAAGPRPAEPPAAAPPPEAPAKADPEKKDRADFQAHLAAGQAALDQGRPADAVRAFTAALVLAPDDAEALRLLRLAEARLDEAHQQEMRREEFGRLMNQAAVALRNRRPDEAVQHYQQALQLFPNDRQAQQALQQARKAHSEARAEFNRLAALGDQALRLQRFEEAIRYYHEALQIFPNDDGAQKAVRSAERAAADLAAGQAAYLRFLNQADRAMQQQRCAEAVLAYQEALRLAPADVETAQRLQQAQNSLAYQQQMLAGNRALARRQFADADRFFQQALRWMPNDPPALQALRQTRYAQHMASGQQALAAHQPAMAARAFEAALREVPNDPAALAALRQARMALRK